MSLINTIRNLIYILSIKTSIQLFPMYNPTKQQLQKQLAIDANLHQHIILVSCLLKDLISAEMEDEDGNEYNLGESIFDSKLIPDISLEDYLRRIHKLTRFSPQSLILAIIIMDRYNIENDDFHLSQLNVHRLLLSCLILAVKLHDDFYYDNKAFQTAGGVNVVMLQKYQFQIFQKCDYNLYIDQEQYNIFLENLFAVYANEQEETDEDYSNQQAVV